MSGTNYIILIFALFLLSCSGNRRTRDSVSGTKRVQDYSLFPQGTILAGDIDEEKTFYLVRQDTKAMKGFCLIDNNRAVVDIINFSADSTGKTKFYYDYEYYYGEMVVDYSGITLTLPEISELGIETQTISLQYFNEIPEETDCPEYYKDPVFENITEGKEIQYGTALGYYVSKSTDHISKDNYQQWFEELKKTFSEHDEFLNFPTPQELRLDVYQPEISNGYDKRPLLLLLHGGAFFFGDKENKTQQALTDYFVKRGYVVASINYRLGTPITPGAIKRAIYRCVQDTRAAVHFLVHDEKYGIDAEQIYLAGSSAGGFISLTTAAFMDSRKIYSEVKGNLLRDSLGGLDATSDYKDPFEIAGVVSLWGGVTDLKILNKEMPTLLFHGEEDDIVPCDKGLPFKKNMDKTVGGKILYAALQLCFGEVYGSQQISQCSIPVTYFSFRNAGHDLHLDSDNTLNENMDFICEKMNEFLYNNVSKHYFNCNLVGDTIVKKHYSAPVYELSNVRSASVQWHVDGGFITKQTNDAIRVLWYNGYETGTVTACITNQNDVSCKKELKVKII